MERMQRAAIIFIALVVSVCSGNAGSSNAGCGSASSGGTTMRDTAIPAGRRAHAENPIWHEQRKEAQPGDHNRGHAVLELANMGTFATFSLPLS